MENNKAGENRAGVWEKLTSPESTVYVYREREYECACVVIIIEAEKVFLIAEAVYTLVPWTSNNTLRGFSG